MSQQNRTKMSVTQLTLLTAINMMGSGIVMLPTKLAEIGTISILSWLITAVGSLCLAYAFAKCGMFSKRPGMGGYSEYAFGKAGNFMANYTYGVSLLFANIAIAITCVGYGAEFLEIELTPVQVCLSTIVVLWICTSANFMGASLTGKFSALAVWCVILPQRLGGGRAGRFEKQAGAVRPRRLKRPVFQNTTNKEGRTGLSKPCSPLFLSSPVRD